MTDSEMMFVVGQLMGCWLLGFSASYVITVLKKFSEKVS